MKQTMLLLVIFSLMGAHPVNAEKAAIKKQKHIANPKVGAAQKAAAVDFSGIIIEESPEVIPMVRKFYSMFSKEDLSKREDLEELLGKMYTGMAKCLLSHGDPPLKGKKKIAFEKCMQSAVSELPALALIRRYPELELPLCSK